MSIVLKGKGNLFDVHECMRKELSKSFRRGPPEDCPHPKHPGNLVEWRRLS